MTKGIVDAALNGQDKYAGKAYFFKDTQYVRYDWNQERVDAGYPLLLSAWNLPSIFSNGIDAALEGQGKYAGKAYFFKGDQYVRYDWNQDKVDAGYPLALSAWNLPGDFASGIDAALNGQGKYAGKAYFFKGDQYVRYDWNRDKVDAGYPLPIVGNWQGITELLKAGLAKTKAIEWILTMQPQLQGYLTSVQTGFSNPLLNVSLIETALQTHFHVAPPQVVSYVPSILQTYQKILNALNNSTNIFRYRNNAEAAADKDVDSSGHPFAAYTFYNSSINFTTTFAKFGPLCQAAMVLHEPVHYVDSKADGAHDFYEHGSQYSTLTPDVAVHNPSSYVCFAEHLFYGKDERFGAGRPNE